jgi:hypothetical protein
MLLSHKVRWFVLPAFRCLSLTILPALGIDAVQQQDGKVTHVVTLTTKSVEIRAIEDGKLVTSIDAYVLSLFYAYEGERKALI